MHEDPMVPNYGRRGRGKRLKNGLVLAIEPMINLGTHRVIQLPDGWTIIAADRKPSAHFEHDVALVDGKPQLLSTFDRSEERRVGKECRSRWSHQRGRRRAGAGDHRLGAG